MIRRRRNVEPSHESSSDEEDAFSALSAKEKRKREEKLSLSGLPADSHSSQSNSLSQPQLPVALTSSMKRHHGILSDSRKSKMDALLQELEAEKERSVYRKEPSFVPDKKGSFVEPWEEHLTTNIFVGNLAPSITEEALTDLFRQFGDLYSVKIMWPRTPEERARNRNTGFVCFMNREDADEAMEACDDADPFNVGRRLMLRWGKNVKKIVKHGTGGVAPIQKRARGPGDELSLPNKRHREEVDETESIRQSLSQSIDGSLSSPKYDPEIHEKDAIRVRIPRDRARARLIATVASFVAKDGSFLERKLIERESGNPVFGFLTMDEGASDQQQEEHIFYRWRVYAFCQGDGMNTWRTKPFVMVYPGGRFWIPPSIDRQAALQEEEEQRKRDESIRRQKQFRRRYGGKRDNIMTGRQIEQRRAAAGAADGGAALTERELEQLNFLVKQRLCASREAICEAMAFCFEKSAAAKQIAAILKDVLTESGSGVSIETRIARLYLLSDILFNSQQPGVRNAFLYRDAIERMAPDVFTSLGRNMDENTGRLTMNKLSTAVSSVLGAWTNWSVYNSAFMDELHARFEGREIPASSTAETLEPNQNVDDPPKEADVSNDRVLINVPRGDWSEITDESQPDQSDANRQPGDNGPKLDEIEPNLPAQNTTAHLETTAVAEHVHSNLVAHVTQNDDCDGVKLINDVNVQPIDDIHGESMDDIDGEPVEEADGSQDDDLDGEPLDDIDGEPIDDVSRKAINEIDS